jgi:hypothetical protein
VPSDWSMIRSSSLGHRVNVADASGLTFMSAHPAGDAERRGIQAKYPCAALGLAIVKEQSEPETVVGLSSDHARRLSKLGGLTVPYERAGDRHLRLRNRLERPGNFHPVRKF